MNTGRSNLDIASRLSATLAALNMKQADLARQCDFPPPRVNNWLKGIARPDIDAAHIICDHLPVTMDWIYRGDASKLPGDLQAKIVAISKAIPIVGTRSERHGRRSA
jgi:transcriptional regulator with XRE-family HTH domain